MLGVVILNWNGGPYLLDCLRSVFEQEPCGAEVVVYLPDNASTDGSLEAAHREFPQVRTIQNGGNLGFSGGNNPGWRQAVADGAEWIFFLNNDAALAPDCLRRLLDVARANPQIGALSPKIYYGTPETHPEGKPRPDSEPEIWFEKGLCEFHWIGGINHTNATPSERASLWYESPLCTGCCFLTTGNLLEETGGFDEGFFAYYEDVDLSLKIRAKGLICAVVPSATAWHKVGQSTSQEATPGFVFYCGRNLIYLAERHAKRPEEFKAFRRMYLRQCLVTATRFARKHNVLMGATFLQGSQFALRGHQGIRPIQKPGFLLMAVVKTLQGVHAVREQIRPTPAESTKDTNPHS